MSMSPALPNTISFSARSLRSEEHTSELQSLRHLVCRLLLEKKKKIQAKQHAKIRNKLLPLKNDENAKRLNSEEKQDYGNNSHQSGGIVQNQSTQRKQ